MIDFMNWWVNELFGSPLLALLGIMFLYNIIMFLGRMSMVVTIVISCIAFIVFSGFLWGSWVTVFMLMGSMVYFGYAVLKFIGPPA